MCYLLVMIFNFRATSRIPQDTVQEQEKLETRLEHNNNLTGDSLGYATHPHFTSDAGTTVIHV